MHNLGAECYLVIRESRRPRSQLWARMRGCVTLTTICIKQTLGQRTHSAAFCILCQTSLPNGRRHKNTLCLWTNASQASGDLWLTARIKEPALELKAREGKVLWQWIGWEVVEGPGSSAENVILIHSLSGSIIDGDIWTADTCQPWQTGWHLFDSDKALDSERQEVRAVMENDEEKKKKNGFKV